MIEEMGFLFFYSSSIIPIIRAATWDHSFICSNQYFIHRPSVSLPSEKVIVRAILFC